jgi:hypothetical protein
LPTINQQLGRKEEFLIVFNCWQRKTNQRLSTIARRLGRKEIVVKLSLIVDGEKINKRLYGLYSKTKNEPKNMRLDGLAEALHRHCIGAA